MQLFRKQQLEMDIEQQAGSKSGREYVKAVYCHSAYLTYMQSTSCKIPGWMKHKLESRLPGEISITSDTQVTPLRTTNWHLPRALPVTEQQMHLTSASMETEPHVAIAVVFQQSLREFTVE